MKPQTYAWGATGMREDTAAPTLWVRAHEVDVALRSELTKLYLLLVEADNGIRDREGVGIGHWIKPAHEQKWAESIAWLRDSVVTKVGDKL